MELHEFTAHIRDELRKFEKFVREGAQEQGQSPTVLKEEPQAWWDQFKEWLA